MKYSKRIVSLVMVLVCSAYCALPVPALTRRALDPEGAPGATGPRIEIDAADPGMPVDPRVLGTNLPSWLNPTRLADEQFRTRVVAAGITVIRMPGGSWSNWYDWLACERGGEGIDANAECYWTWAARPTDFLSFLRATGLEGMYTINQNGTAKEAAALVAFFNGAVDDDRAIGIDVRGRDWGKVSDWAQLRSENGNPDPLPMRYWEIGNEIYGGTKDSGADCSDWGWEGTWTCDGTEYVEGIGSGSDRKEGYLEFRDAMRDVDPEIEVGAVGVPFQADWSDWGNEVIASAGSVMDFYVIHQYAYFDPPASYQEVLAQPHGIWSDIAADVDDALAKHAKGRDIPIALTEYNLFSVEERDPDEWMSRAVNGLHMVDTIGQMMQNGIQMANQWDVAHREGASLSGYGLMQASTDFRSPQYYAFPLWARFGETMLPVNSSLPVDQLSVYAGRAGADTISLLAVNKTASEIEVTIEVDGMVGLAGGTADVMQAASLDATSVTWNGLGDPADDLSDAPAQPLTVNDAQLSYTFAPYSATLLRLNAAAEQTYALYAPLACQDNAGMP